MTGPHPESASPGGLPVGALAELGPLERRAVLRLRAFAPSRAAAEDTAIRVLLEALARSGRRPILRHRPDCPCLGADEAAFALLIGHAARGEMTEALVAAGCLAGPEALTRILPLARAAAAALDPPGRCTLH